jgi:putative addiction module component (TIGR02574 family)
MPSAALKRALDIALGLPATDRAALVHDLLASLDDPPDTDAAEAWEVEIAQRLDDFQAGKAKTVDAADALDRIDARLRQR